MPGELLPTSRERIVKQDGVTDAERRLSRLCDQTFLSLWSYPSVFRDQGKQNDRADGKEVCDLLVIFGNDVIIFSDKDCEYPSTGSIDLDWSRWFRKGVLKSAEQIWGAERWMRAHPDRLFLDRKCSARMPINLPDMREVRFHRIVVAHAAAARCRELLGGSGTLVILPSLKGKMHYDGPVRLEGAADLDPRALFSTVLKDDATYAGKVLPFTIGDIDPAKGYVHVFDDASLEVVMSTLDTASDFIEYLTRKESYIRGGHLGFACGEDDLLAHYLKRTGPSGNHDFYIMKDQAVAIPAGEWEKLISSPEWRRWKEANEVSYFWDALIERFNQHILDGKPQHVVKSSFEIQEKAVRSLAKENRFNRRLLWILFNELRHKNQSKQIAARIVQPLRVGGPHYILLTLSHDGVESEEKYRKLRVGLGMSYCLALKARFPDAKDVVIVAGDPAAEGDLWSQDALYRDLTNLTPQEIDQGKRIRQELGLLSQPGTPVQIDMREFPNLPGKAHDAVARYTGRGSQPKSRAAKGRSLRNSLCACGSKKKYKECCMRKSF